MNREITNLDFGLWMKEMRKKHHWSQEQLADRVNCHTTSIGRWERAEDYPKLDVAEDIIKAFGAEILIREHGKTRD